MEWDHEGKLQSLKHSFLISDICPVNVLARDLICSMQLSLISTPAGLIVVTTDLTSADLQCFDFTSDPLYVYQSLLESPASEELLTQATEVLDSS